MSSFVYDFKDIASRMKGELKAQPKLGVCRACEGEGRFKIGDWSGVPIYEHCTVCDGIGVDP